MKSGKSEHYIHILWAWTVDSIKYLTQIFLSGSDLGIHKKSLRKTGKLLEGWMGA